MFWFILFWFMIVIKFWYGLVIEEEYLNIDFFVILLEFWFINKYELKCGKMYL